jgi:hypothetical protein
MKESERIVVTEITILMLLVWLGFLVHQSPRFPGSFWGSMLGIAGAALMLVPIVYSVIKRVPVLRSHLPPFLSMRTLLTWHVYAGLTGPILALLHTGHKFDSPLGVGLTAIMLVVAISGFIGRYLYLRAAEDRTTKESLLVGLQDAYRKLSSNFRPVQVLEFASSENQIVSLAESIADVEYAIKTDELFKRFFRLWLKIHVLIASIFYLALGLHVWSSIHFGLRWYWTGAGL